MKNFLTWAVGIITLIAMILGINKCRQNSYKAPVADTVNVTIVDTMYLHDTIFSKPKVVTRIVKEYLPANEDCKVLKGQYEGMAELYNSQYVYQDSIPVDHGSIKITDTVFQNAIIGRRVVPSFNIPITHTERTITLPAEAVRQLYFNYGLDGGYKLDVVSNQWSAGVVAGFTYKDRQDRMYTANGSFNTDNQIRIMLVRSGKISFKRKK